MKIWEELTEKERTPEAGYAEALRRIEECKFKKSDVLFLNNLLLNEIPSEVKDLTQLETFSVSNNNLTQLLYVNNLKKLTRIDFWGNQITNISSLKGLEGLSTILGSNNDVSDLTPISELQSLKFATFQRNPVRSIRPLKRHLEKGLELFLDFEEKYNNCIIVDSDNLKDTPSEILHEGSQAILEFWLTQETGAQINYTGRILLLGKGRAGKTTLRRKLEKSTAPIPSPIKAENASTMGVRVTLDYMVPAAPDGRLPDLTAHVWDFGGQEDQYYTHQYFFGQNSLYVIVVDVASGLGDLDYWLRLVDLHGRRDDGKPTQVVLVMNEKNAPQAHHYDLSSFRKTFPELRLNPVDVDLSYPCRTYEGNDPRFADELLPLLHAKFRKLPLIGKEIPAPTEPIVEAFRKEREAGKHYLEWNRVREICKDNGIEKEDIARAMMTHLKTRGEIMYFSDAATESDRFQDLRDYVFLDFDWTTDAIYSLLTVSKKEYKNGRFPLSLLNKTWGAAYGPTDRLLLKNLLLEHALEVCFVAKDNQNQLIAASLLPTESPGLPLDETHDRRIRFRVNYPDHIPVGLVTRLIVRKNAYLDGDHFYRDGAVFRDEASGVRIRVERDPSNRHFVNLEVDEDGEEGKHLLGIFRDAIRGIERDVFRDLKSEPLIVCPCPTCNGLEIHEAYKYNYEPLLDQLRENPDKVRTCDKSNQELRADHILGAIFREMELRHFQHDMVSMSRSHAEELVRAKGNTTYVTAERANVVSGSGGQVVHESAEAAQPFIGYLFEREHIRVSLAWLALAGAVGMGVYYFVPGLRDYAFVIVAIVTLYGMFVGLQRQGKYYRFARWAFGIGFGMLSVLTSLPMLEGVVRTRYEEDGGTINGIFHFLLDTPPSLNVVILVLTTVIVLVCLWLQYREDNKAGK